MSLRQDVFLHYSRYLAKDVFRYAQIYLIKNRTLLCRPKRSVSTRDSGAECGFLKGSIRVAELRKQKKAPQRVLFFCFGGAGGNRTRVRKPIPGTFFADSRSFSFPLQDTVRQVSSPVALLSMAGTKANSPRMFTTVLTLGASRRPLARNGRHKWPRHCRYQRPKASILRQP